MTRSRAQARLQRWMRWNGHYHATHYHATHDPNVTFPPAFDRAILRYQAAALNNERRRLRVGES